MKATTPQGAGTAITNPAEIIKDFLTRSTLGNLDAQFVDDPAFTQAATDITTTLAFALTTVQHLNDLCGRLAFNALALFFWDQGRAFLKKLNVQPEAGDSVLTLNSDDTEEWTTAVAKVGLREIVTEMAAEWQPHVPSPTFKYVRESADAEEVYSEKQKSIKLDFIQYPPDVALVLEDWLRHALNFQRTVTVTTYLNALHLQPGDIITLDLATGVDGKKIFDGALARVEKITHTPLNPRTQTMEKFVLECSVSLWTWAVVAVVPPTEVIDTCTSGSGKDPDTTYNHAPLGFPDPPSLDYQNGETSGDPNPANNSGLPQPSDKFESTERDANPCRCGCANCEDNDAPDAYEMSFSGIALSSVYRFLIDDGPHYLEVSATDPCTWSESRTNDSSQSYQLKYTITQALVDEPSGQNYAETYDSWTLKVEFWFQGALVASWSQDADNLASTKRPFSRFNCRGTPSFNFAHGDAGNPNDFSQTTIALDGTR